MFHRRGFLIGVAVTASAALPRANRTLGASPALSNALDRYFAPFERARDFSGIVVIERGKQQLVQTWGRAEFASGRPHTLHTRYAAESISKMFTHAAVLGLQSAGKLSMSDPLARFIPDFPRSKEITIRQLVDHEAGISRDLAFVGGGGSRPHSTTEIVSLIAKTENAAPGHSSYSNNGYRILARVIELAGGGGFEDLVRELVFEPRRMGETVFGGNTRQPMERRATGYIPDYGWRTIRKADPWDFSNSRGAASYFTSPADLMRFLRTLPLEPQDVGNAKGALEGGRFARAAGHDGFGSGFANLAFADPNEDTRLVLLGNIQSGLFMSLQKDMRAILAGEPADGPKIDRPSELGPTDRWRAYVGSYELRPGAPLVIRRAGDHLEVSAGEEFHPLIAVARNRFFMRLRYASMSFPAAPAPVDAIRWEEGGNAFTLKKLS
jgi:CubicO group peptidase (beta-lactamase class C family)